MERVASQARSLRQTGTRRVPLSQPTRHHALPQVVMPRDLVQGLRCERSVSNVVSIIVQRRVELAEAGMPHAASLHGKSNIGDVLDAVLRSAGWDWSSDGKSLWRVAFPARRFHWQEPKAPNSRQPAERPSALATIADVNLEHCAPAGGRRAGGRAAAVEAVRPPSAPAEMRLVAPDKKDVFTKIGTGWGNSPAPLQQRFIAEAACVRDLALRVQQHACTCPHPLVAVAASDGKAYWSAHSMGAVGVMCFVCDDGCRIPWSSAKPLPGRPAPPPATGEPAAPAAAEQAAAQPAAGAQALAPERVRADLLRSLRFAQRTRSFFSFADVAREMGLPHDKNLRRFVSGETATPVQPALVAYAKWAADYPAPAAQTSGWNYVPSDYFVNISVHIGQRTCGVRYGRLEELLTFLRLGKLGDTMSNDVAHRLTPLMEQMDTEDSRHVAELCLLARDLSGGTDGFHSSNREALWGMAALCSSMWGLVIKLAINNRIKDAGGVAQQLEKVGVKQVLRQSIVELGIPFDDLCTDPCRGAPKDIREVLALQIVQKMLHLLPDEVTKWVAERLGVLPAASAGVAPPGGRQLRQWADIVAGLDVVLPTIELSDTQRRGIHHHLDVFHVEVKVYDALKTLVTGATKRVKGDKSAEKKKVGNGLPCQHKPLNKLLLELRSRTTLRLEGNEAAQLGDMDTNGWVDVNKKPSVKIKQAILLRHRESEGAPAEATPPDPASRPERANRQ